MLPSNLFSLPVQTEVFAAGEVLRRRNEVLTSVLHLESGRCCAASTKKATCGTSWVRWKARSGSTLHRRCSVCPCRWTWWLKRVCSCAGYRLRSSAKAGRHARRARGLLLDMASGYRQQSELAVSRLAHDAETRCAQWLLNHAQQDASGTMRVTLHQRKRLIAAQLGIAPETFSRVLRHLREMGLIHGTGNVLNLPQPLALQTMAGS